MSYTISLTDGTVLNTPTMPAGTLADGTTDSTTGLTLVGRNYTGYGGIQNENFVKLLENFADTIPPTQSVNATIPLVGTLWYDTGNNVLKVFDGANFNVISGRQAGATAPTAKNIGDQWWDTVNLQLNSWTGTAWQVVGPNYTASQGLTGSIPGTIVDTNNSAHTVANTYTSGQLVSIASYDAAFTPATPIANFPAIISPGITVSNTATFVGTATNSTTVGGLVPSVFARKDLPTTFVSDITVTGNIVNNGANISVVNNAFRLHNHNIQGNVELRVTLDSGFPTGSVTALKISGIDGSAQVYTDPTTPTGIATKNYVDTQLSSVGNNLTVITAELNANVTALETEYLANISTTTQNLTNQITVVQNAAIANINAVASALVSNVTAIVANLATTATNINTLNGGLNTKAPILSPAFTGTPTAPTAAPGNNSTLIATTAYVDSAANVLARDYNAKFASASSALTAAVSSSTNGYAPLASPAFTGTPTAPTPSSGDNSGTLATTAFVHAAVGGIGSSWQGSGYTVAGTPPTGGNNGDFWFQVG